MLLTSKFSRIRVASNPFSPQQREDGQWVVVDQSGEVKAGPFPDKGRAYEASHRLWESMHTMAST